ncbi:MAG: C4-dicarboxylate ABC transporter, partial [Methylibium sp.]|nr:C4-dicarboxylate ABC transporter [Methylibium sp.]
LTTAQIYKGSIAFIVLQLIMVAVVVMNPGLVSGGIEKGPVIDADKALREMSQPTPFEAPAPVLEPPVIPSDDAASEPADAGEEADDPVKALEESMKRDAQPR